MPHRDPNTIAATLGGFLVSIIATFKATPVQQFEASIMGAVIGAAVSFFTSLLCKFLWGMVSTFFTRLYEKWKR